MTEPTIPAEAPSQGAAKPRAIRRREVVGYCMFDFANSSYTTMISTVAFSVYFKQAVVGSSSTLGDFWWSVAQASAMGVLILISPVMGALADYSGRKKAFLLGSTALTVTACACLFFVRPGYLPLGILLYVIGTVGFDGGYTFYNAFLPEVSTPGTIGRISGWSWGTGFIGGLVALVACIPFLRVPLVDSDTGALVPEAVWGYRVSFLVVAGFFALFAVPTFLFLRESSTPRSLHPFKRFISMGFKRVSGTVRHLREYSDVSKYILAAFFFYGGIQTVIKFSAIYATETFGIEGIDLLMLFVITNIIAVPGTLLSGYLADFIGGKRALIVTLVFWAALLVLGSMAGGKVTFWIMASGIAIGMGSTQAIGRAFMSQISPDEREAEFFGFYILAGQTGAIFALLTFGSVSSFGGGQRLAVMLTAPLFLIASGLVMWIKNPAGPRRADTNERA